MTENVKLLQVFAQNAIACRRIAAARIAALAGWAEDGRRRRALRHDRTHACPYLCVCACVCTCLNACPYALTAHMSVRIGTSATHAPWKPTARTEELVAIERRRAQHMSIRMATHMSIHSLYKCKRACLFTCVYTLPHMVTHLSTRVSVRMSEHLCTVGAASSNEEARTTHLHARTNMPTHMPHCVCTCLCTHVYAHVYAHVPAHVLTGLRSGLCTCLHTRLYACTPGRNS